ncbi:MAG: histidine triad nucleotide-binding protein [Deltaproteobacteria bacterium]|nr:histidine triad nucleotide-binding protein [Deltaproteobacteria bacterium]
MDCVFCKIRDGELPAEFEYRDDHVMVFKDLNPVAPYHYLVVPTEHIESINQAGAAAAESLTNLFLAAEHVAKKLGFEKNGYRCVINTGANAGQVVMHLHMHLLAGREFSWPPG